MSIHSQCREQCLTLHHWILPSLHKSEHRKNTRNKNVWKYLGRKMSMTSNICPSPWSTSSEFFMLYRAGIVQMLSGKLKIWTERHTNQRNLWPWLYAKFLNSIQCDFLMTLSWSLVYIRSCPAVSPSYTFPGTGADLSTMMEALATPMLRKSTVIKKLQQCYLNTLKWTKFLLIKYQGLSKYMY